MNKTDLTLIELTEENIESMIYEIRGQRVMLDFDLARIYGYSTKAFNQQIQRNIERFDEDFMFQLTKEELDELVRSQIVTARTVSPLENCKNIVTESDNFVRSKKSTARIWNFGNTGGRTTLPYAFTEQGIYMLMTVLKGELAVKQSKTIIRLFKQMKDYIISHDSDELLRLSKQAYENKQAIVKLEKDNNDTGRNLVIYPTNNKIHDRYIVIDYKKDNERLFDSGASSKDAGHKIMTILEIGDKEAYYGLIDNLFNNGKIL